MDHRWTEAHDIMKKIRDGAEGGIPWFAIWDADGKVLATSNNPYTGNNIGFPSSAPSEAHFVNMLKTTRQSMSNQEIQNLANAASKRD